MSPDAVLKTGGLVICLKTQCPSGFVFRSAIWTGERKEAVRSPQQLDWRPRWRHRRWKERCFLCRSAGELHLETVGAVEENTIPGLEPDSEGEDTGVPVQWVASEQSSDETDRQRHRRSGSVEARSLHQRVQAQKVSIF